MLIINWYVTNESAALLHNVAAAITVKPRYNENEQWRNELLGKQMHENMAFLYILNGIFWVSQNDIRKSHNNHNDISGTMIWKSTWWEVILEKHCHRMLITIK